MLLECGAGVPGAFGAPRCRLLPLPRRVAAAALVLRAPPSAHPPTPTSTHVQRVPGVVRTAVGYAQGQVSNPSYEQVCGGGTGHTEAVQLTYRPAEVTFDQLCDTFFKKINPTQRNGQGNDRGSQYRTGIYWHDEEQRAVAQARVAAIPNCAVEAEPFASFWAAEGYHQQVGGRGWQQGVCVCACVCGVGWRLGRVCRSSGRLACACADASSPPPPPPTPLACSTWRRGGAAAGGSQRPRCAQTRSGATGEEKSCRQCQLLVGRTLLGRARQPAL